MRILWVTRDWREIALSCWFTDFPLNGLTARFAASDSLAETLELAAGHRAHWRSELSGFSYNEVSYEEIVTSGGLPAGTLTFVRNGHATPTEKSGGEREWVNSPTYAEVQNPPSRERLGRWENYEGFAPSWFERLGRIDGK